MIPKKILFIEPFYKGSHKYFLDNIKKYSKHDITILTRNGVFWKWKFLESSIINELSSDHDFDVIIGSNMLDLSSWAGMNRKLIGKAKLALYFHENQLTYPENLENKSKNEFFGFQNLTSLFCADKVFFNSDYHKTSLLNAARRLSQKLPDSIPVHLFKELENKATVVPVGLDLELLDKVRADTHSDVPVILWNHRWEFDKNPKLFLKTLMELKDEGLKFKLIMLGSAPKKLDPIFAEAHEYLKDEITQWGRVKSKNDYARLLWQADILPVTSNHDFFGVSVLEAIYCELSPLLPKRCAYPDHFPIEKFSEIFYDSDYSFKEKLRSQLKATGGAGDILEMKKIIEEYSWSKVSAMFDDEINNLT